jgi:hypothetical protein
MRRIFGALRLVGLVVLATTAANGATGHSRRGIAHRATALSKQARDAYGFAAPVDKTSQDVPNYDEALSPPVRQ